jgi:hypothetical protein
MSAVLLLAYRRWQNIDVILDACRDGGVARVYLHIDGGTTRQEVKDITRTLEMATSYKKQSNLDIRIAVQTKNIGCAVSMILSLNSIFREEDQIIVLEDDCIPAWDFFKFIQSSFQQMKKDSRIGIVCGAQFAPFSVTTNKWFLSRYPLNWGWGITKSQWALLSSRIVETDKLKVANYKLNNKEIIYWNAGARRALQGYTDVWDTLLVREMIRHDSYSILPGVNLVQNIGNDEHALHTSGVQLWTDYPTGSFDSKTSSLEFNPEFDRWARSTFYGISSRHILSTKITWFLDYFLRKPKRKPLSERIQLAEVNFDK